MLRNPALRSLLLRGQRPRFNVFRNGTCEIDANWLKDTGWAWVNGVYVKTPGTGANFMRQLPTGFPGGLYGYEYEVVGTSAGSCNFYATVSGGSTFHQASMSANGIYGGSILMDGAVGQAGVRGLDTFNGGVKNLFFYPLTPLQT